MQKCSFFRHVNIKFNFIDGLSLKIRTFLLLKKEGYVTLPLFIIRFKGNVGIDRSQVYVSL